MDRGYFGGAGGVRLGAEPLDASESLDFDSPQVYSGINTKGAWLWGSRGWRLSQDVGGPKEAGLARDGPDAASEEQRVTSCQSCGSAKQTHSSPSEASSRRSVQSWSPSFGKKEAVVSGFNSGEGSKRTGALRDSRFWRDR